MMRNILFFMLLASVIAGCTSARISRNLSSGAIGCPSQEIQITNETAGIEGTHNWTAVCKGQTFICSYHTTTGANCTKALK